MPDSTRFGDHTESGQAISTDGGWTAQEPGANDHVRAEQAREDRLAAAPRRGDGRWPMSKPPGLASATSTPKRNFSILSFVRAKRTSALSNAAPAFHLSKPPDVEGDNRLPTCAGQVEHRSKRSLRPNRPPPSLLYPTVPRGVRERPADAGYRGSCRQSARPLASNRPSECPLAS